MSQSVRIDRAKHLADEPHTGHNRWHPHIDPILEVDPGEEVVLETRDALDGYLNGSSSVADLGTVALGAVHPLTGPVLVKGAHPGDLLEIEFVNIDPQPWAFSSIMPGLGFLRELVPSRILPPDADGNMGRIARFSPAVIHWLVLVVPFTEKVENRRRAFNLPHRLSGYGRKE